MHTGCATAMNATFEKHFPFSKAKGAVYLSNNPKRNRSYTQRKPCANRVQTSADEYSPVFAKSIAGRP